MILMLPDITRCWSILCQCYISWCCSTCYTFFITAVSLSTNIIIGATIRKYCMCTQLFMFVPYIWYSIFVIGKIKQQLKAYSRNPITESYWCSKFNLILDLFIWLKILLMVQFRLCFISVVIIIIIIKPSFLTYFISINGKNCTVAFKSILDTI